ncbi:hypothetical protein COV19_07295 [Candidatus Woesearchaeota archaeon CG10_big_fil_rev_8_21_14_0_10_44_13]|nr:MAG: hypothetical protein COV19_07295 [Candidatus Woesearchaeota archaeon CG10_big_fil_rev_8_21_14_0_10_44_13]
MIMKRRPIIDERDHINEGLEFYHEEKAGGVMAPCEVVSPNPPKRSLYCGDTGGDADLHSHPQKNYCPPLDGLWGVFLNPNTSGENLTITNLVGEACELFDLKVKRKDMLDMKARIEESGIPKADIKEFLNYLWREGAKGQHIVVEYSEGPTEYFAVPDPALHQTLFINYRVIDHIMQDRPKEGFNLNGNQGTHTLFDHPNVKRYELFGGRIVVAALKSTSLEERAENTMRDSCKDGPMAGAYSGGHAGRQSERGN